MQTLLLMVVIMLGVQMFMNTRNAPDGRSAPELLKSMQTMNSQIKDISIVGEFSKFEAKINDQVGKKELTVEVADQQKLQGKLLVADTQFRAGMLRNDFGRLSNAYNTLHPLFLVSEKNPAWNSTTVELGAHSKFPEKTASPGPLYEKIRDTVNARSKTDLVMGVIPGYDTIDALVKLTGSASGFSYAFAAFILALIVRAAIFPLAQKQYRWGKQMQQLQPILAEVKEAYTDKKTGQISNMAEYQARSMEVYKAYGFNPFAGCWPALIQIPFFLIIYQCMLHYRFEFQKGTFLWVNPATSASTNGWIAPNLGERDYLLVLVYAITMIVTTLMTPVSDPTNQKQQRLMGVSMAVIFSIMMFFYPLPSAFTLYWIFLNIFATAQMLYAYRMPVPPLEKKTASTGGVFPVNGKMNNGASLKTGTPVKHRPKKKK